jgi:Fe-S-cluster-containing hydrogenase component 2
MPVIPELEDAPLVRDDEEGLFDRAVNGQLVRLDAPTEADYEKRVKMQIDGQEIEVPMAEPLTDANGNVVVDLEGRTTPRYTTIYDAAVKLYVKQPGDEQKIPIPILCHQPHMKPVAVCRLCVVQIYGMKRGKRAAERKLLPACQHQVKNGMEVFTMNDQGADGERVRTTVKVMTELLATDHLKPVMEGSTPDLNDFNELALMAQRCGANPDKYKVDVLSTPPPDAAPQRGRRTFDSSSPVFLVDHSACILCERCIRACDDVQENHVIGRTGKGATAGISFDLNDLMGRSSCVQCGECMVSCPTSAITFKPVAQVNIKKSRGSAEIIPAADLTQDALFRGVPAKFLYWQQGLVTRRRLKRGELLCRQGEAGNTAFIIKEGKLQVQVYPKKRAEGGLLAGLLGGRRDPLLRFELSPANVIVGEMACLSGTPRSADVVALEDGEVWEVRRNVLDRLMRLPTQRARFEKEYRERSMDLVLQETELFKGLPDTEYRQILDFLRTKLTFVRVNPGQILFKQGDRVTDLYFVRLGHVRVAIERNNVEVKVISSGPGSVLGETGLLGLTAADASRSFDEVEKALVSAFQRNANDLSSTFPVGLRTATCSALGHLELARLTRGAFLEMIAQFPQLRRKFVEQSLARLRSNDQGQPILREFVEQGLFEGTSILTLNLDKCTRCDECTRGCIEQHGTESHGLHIPRLLRDGLRFENYLIATSCRSCLDPHCMFGCPVDSIHRGRHLQIVIEDHCIGCGLCAENCPYGNINMVPNQHRRIEVFDPENPGRKLSVAQPKASTCDLCDAEGTKSKPEPRCVSSCPHEAAERMTGDALLQKVLSRPAKRR